jgi:catechol 2,3-dioxygenase-like lactoylglutathione lyase family enzyme
LRLPSPTRRTFRSLEPGRVSRPGSPPGVEPVLPDMGVDIDSREAVDAAHAQALRAGHEVIYGPVDEPWGVRRFFVRDPQGVVISVLAHE